MKSAGVVEMEMRWHRYHGQGGQTSRHWRDIAKPWSGVEEQSPLSSTDEIIPVDLVISRFADSENARRDFLDRVPVVVPMDPCGEHEVCSLSDHRLDENPHFDRVAGYILNQRKAGAECFTFSERL